MASAWATSDAGDADFDESSDSLTMKMVYLDLNKIAELISSLCVFNDLNIKIQYLSEFSDFVVRWKKKTRFFGKKISSKIEGRLASRFFSVSDHRNLKLN